VPRAGHRGGEGSEVQPQGGTIVTRGPKAGRPSRHAARARSCRSCGICGRMPRSRCTRGAAATHST
jgi:hypothetical protein